MEETRVGNLVYSPTARRFHWWTVALVFIMINFLVDIAYAALDPRLRTGRA